MFRVVIGGREVLVMRRLDEFVGRDRVLAELEKKNDRIVVVGFHSEHVLASDGYAQLLKGVTHSKLAFFFPTKDVVGE